MNHILSAENLVVGYKSSYNVQKKVCGPLNLDLKSGELVTLLGPNGAGKSTLLRTIARIQDSLAGKISIHNRLLGDYNMRELACLIAVVLTDKVSSEYLSVYELVSLGRTPYTNSWGGLKARDCRIIEWALKETNSWAFRNRSIDTLSDGEKQKVMIARALAQEPKILLLDEPTAFLDLVHKIKIFRLLKSLAREKQLSILISSHDFDIATRISDKIWLLDSKGEVTTGAPEDLMLSGAFKEVFSKDDIKFNSEFGTFEVLDPPQNHIMLKGEGSASQCTIKALQRVGFGISEDQSIVSGTVSIHQESDEICWNLVTPNASGGYHTIYDLIQALSSG
ncbi:ABC transporter ATP-binding protein [bacterium]|nr:ABC transporter ATP-binding protein [bacterium]